MTKDDAHDFSSNRCDSSLTTPSLTLKEFQVPVRNPDPSFDDGNIAILSEQTYFLVHRGVLSHHSVPLREMISNALEDAHNAPLIEGRIALVLPHPPSDLSYFLKVLYGYASISDSMWSKADRTPDSRSRWMEVTSKQRLPC